MITISFREKEKGWCSFYSYHPEEYLRLGNISFCIDKGQLWEQNDQDNPITNTFFGNRFPSKISTVFNEAANEDKVFKTFAIEGNSPWEVNLKTNLTETSLLPRDFSKRESRFFTHLRQNENDSDLNGCVQGIGVIKSYFGSELVFESVTDLVNIGDQLYKLDGNKHELIGTIVFKTVNSVSLSNEPNGQLVGLFAFSKRNSRVDGAQIRGYYADVTLENNEEGQVELFAVNSNIIKSYV